MYAFINQKNKHKIMGILNVFIEYFETYYLGNKN